MTTRRYVIDSINSDTGVVQTDCQESNTVSVDIRGTFTGLLQFEASMNGDDWFSVAMIPTAAGSQTSTITSTNTTGTWLGNVVSAIKFRVRASSWSSGTATLQIRVSDTSSPYVFLSGVTTTVLTPSTVVGGFPSSHHLISSNTTNPTLIKSSAGMVGNITVSNASASNKYFKLYNKTTLPVVGTDVPILTLLVPANQTVVFCPNLGLRLTGFGYALTGGIAVSDTTAVGLNEMSVHIDYV